MARQPIVIGPKSFKYQKDAIEYFRDLLSISRANVTVDGEHHEILSALIERHPKATRKIGVGIKRFYKAPTEMGTSCFWLERVDGTKTDFSFYAAVKAKGKSLYQEFAEACRNAVKNDLEDAKKGFFEQYGDEDRKVSCDITGEKLAIYESHLDHKKPLTFQVIVRTFIIANKIEIQKSILSMSQDGQFETTFVDQSIKHQFIAYHRQVADLRIINPSANASLGGSERITKSKQPVLLRQP